MATEDPIKVACGFLNVEPGYLSVGDTAKMKLKIGIARPEVLENLPLIESWIGKRPQYLEDELFDVKPHFRVKKGPVQFTKIRLAVLFPDIHEDLADLSPPEQVLLIGEKKSTTFRPAEKKRLANT